MHIKKHFNKLVKLSLVISYFFLTFCSYSFTYKQTKIPLNNKNGVPFYKFDDDYYIDGFEIDGDTNFYFLGGEISVLACMHNRTQIYRKVYTNFSSNQIYINNNNMYILDYKYDRNNLFVLNKNNGTILNNYQNIIKNSINSYMFCDTFLILEIFNSQAEIDMSTELGFVLYSLNGRYFTNTKNRYNLPLIIYPQEFEKKNIEYLGKWNNNYVFWDFNLDKRLCIFLLINENGELIDSAEIDDRLFGQPFYGNPIEHRKLRNESIYILCRDNENAIITELPLNHLFNHK